MNTVCYWDIYLVDMKLWGIHADSQNLTICFQNDFGDLNRLQYEPYFLNSTLHDKYLSAR